jgi:four helix bundle protein
VVEEGSEKGLGSLKLWQRAIEFAEHIHKIVLPALPVEEKWCLTQQLRRSAQSVPANIAEGYGRFYYQEGIRFCYIARGSLEETYSHLFLASRLRYLSEEIYQNALDLINELKRMISGYIAFLKQSKRGASEPGARVSEDSEDYSVNYEIGEATNSELEV